MKLYEDTPHFRELRRNLVNSIYEKGITDKKVLDALNTIPRQFFMKEDIQDMAYVDKAFPIDEGQTISQPYTVAYQTQLLDVHPDHRVLEIGTGSAYQAVILARLAGEVFSIERQRKLYEKNRSFDYLRDFGNLFLFYGDGFEGLPEYAPFDRILITAAAPFIPPRLVEQLKTGGKMVLPLGKESPQKMVRIQKLNDGQLLKEYFSNFSFVPMLEGKK